MSDTTPSQASTSPSPAASRLSGFARSFQLLPWRTAAKVVRTIGFDYIDLWVDMPRKPTGTDRYIQLAGSAVDPVKEGEAVRQFLASIDLMCANALAFHPTPVNTQDGAARVDLLADYEMLARFCRAAGIPTVLYLPGDALPELGEARSYTVTMEGVARVHEVLARHGIQSALEAHFDSSVGQPDSALRLLEDVPGLGYTIDCSHWIYKGYSLEAVWPLLTRATHFHLRQAAPGRLQARFEEGTIDFAEVIRRAEGAGYQGKYCCEYLHQKRFDMDTLDVMTEVLKMKALAVRLLEQTAKAGRDDEGAQKA